jgi:hypothetical protein
VANLPKSRDARTFTPCSHPTEKDGTLHAHKVPAITARMIRCQENPDKLEHLSQTDPSPRTTLHTTCRPSNPGLDPSGKPA